VGGGRRLFSRVCGGDGVDEDVDGVTETAGGDECVIGG
ncbi:hypothetical protein Tco_1152449, partial [Tanacetum coccineum]